MTLPHLGNNSIPARQGSRRDGPRSTYLPPEAETNLEFEAPRRPHAIDNHIVLKGMKRKSHWSEVNRREKWTCETNLNRLESRKLSGNENRILFQQSSTTVLEFSLG